MLCDNCIHKDVCRGYSGKARSYCANFVSCENLREWKGSYQALRVLRSRCTPDALEFFGRNLWDGLTIAPNWEAANGTEDKDSV